MIRIRKRLATKKILVATVGVAALSFAIACEKKEPPQAPVGNLMPPRDWAMPDASAAEALEAGGPDAAVDATITMPTGVADAGFAAARDAGVVPVKRVKPDFRTSTGNLMAPDDVRSPAPTPTTRPRAPTPTPTVPPKSGGR